MRNYLKLLPAVALLGGSLAWASPVDTTDFTATTFAANDDGSVGPVNLGFSADFFGVTTSQVYVNNNGNLTFSGPLSAYTPGGLQSSSLPIIAPFWADVDTRGAGSGLTTYGTGTYDGYSAFDILWPAVGYYGAQTDKLDTFQVILVDRSDLGAGDFDIYFNYGPMQWETGQASGGVDGLGGSCAVAGYSNGTGAGAGEVTYELPGSSVCGALIDGGADALSSNTNDGVTGQYEFEAINGQVVTPPSATPEPSSLLLLGTGALSMAGVIRRKLTA
jgi:hypothetical protein